MISNHIEDLLVATKENKNGEWRNKVISHLKDALAASKMMEWESTPTQPFNGLGGHENRQLGHVPTEPTQPTKNPFCTCPAGAVDSHCAVHGQL